MVFHKMGGKVYNINLFEVYNINLFYGTALRIFWIFYPISALFEKSQNMYVTAV